MRCSVSRAVQLALLLAVGLLVAFKMRAAGITNGAISIERVEAIDVKRKSDREKMLEADERFPATPPPVIYEDAPIPTGWTQTDWTALPADRLATATEEEKTASSLKKYAFNAHKSNQMPLRRPLGDFRPPECKSARYPARLPRASVIICFAEEMWSSLFRTVWSVLDRTPAHLLQEILLVNDASTAPWLQADLDMYLRGLPPVVRMIRSPERLGLIRARTLGAGEAQGEVLIFLDSHCEASAGWAEPLLARIAENERYVICPVIDSISDRSMDYHYGGGAAVGGFHWTLDFTWIYRPLAAGRTAADPMPSPTMAGGLFAIHRRFWEQLGKYDLGMGGWGGENLELSFRIWTCGGELEIHPCSHVGHIFRGAHPYDVPGGFGETYLKNSKRLAEVWMDDYKDIYYLVRPSAKNLEVGDMSDRIALRKRLNCKPFQHFMDLFFQDKYVPKLESMMHRGHFRAEQGLCIDTLGHQHTGETLGMYGCHGQATASLNQAFIFTNDGQIRTIWDKCWSASGGDRSVRLGSCSETRVWAYDEATKAIKHVASGLCMDGSDSNLLVVAPCSTASPMQRWTFSEQLNS